MQLLCGNTQSGVTDQQKPRTNPLQDETEPPPPSTGDARAPSPEHGTGCSPTLSPHHCIPLCKHCLTLWKAHLEELFFHQESEFVFWQWGPALIRAAWSPPARVGWRAGPGLGRAGMSALAAASASRPSGVIQEQLSVPGMAQGTQKHQKECGKVRGARTCRHSPPASFCLPSSSIQSPAPRALARGLCDPPKLGGF